MPDLTPFQVLTAVLCLVPLATLALWLLYKSSQDGPPGW